MEKMEFLKRHDSFTICVGDSCYTLSIEEASTQEQKIRRLLERIGVEYNEVEISSKFFCTDFQQKTHIVSRGDLLDIWYALKKVLKVK